MGSKRRFAVAVGMFSLSLFVSALANGQEAFTIPKSNRVIFGELTLPNKSKVSFVVRDGTWVTVEDRRERYFFGFNGIINDRTGRPNFVPYELTRLTPEDTKVNELNKSSAEEFTSPDAAADSRDVRIGKTVTFDSARGIKIKVTGTGEWVFAAPYITDISQYSEQELEQEFGDSGNGVCCVTCQGRTICASAVDTSCGDCGGGGGGGAGFPVY